jgi:prepilin-type N-terminal cleavage/methylation domain-containing protein
MSSFQVPRPAERCPGRSRAGFTLIEVLVAMVIAGVLASVIFQLIQGQAGFVEIQSGRQEVQQNSRGPLELVSSELRAVPPGAIVNAQPNRIEMWVPRVWGLTCQEMTSGSDKTVWALIPRGRFPTNFPADPSSASNWKLAAPAADGTWRFVTIVSRTFGTPACDPSFATQDLSNYDAVQLRYSGLGSSRPIGSEIFIGELVVYESGTGVSSPRIWVKRNNGASSPQVMAGPLTDADGLVFSYWCGNNQVAAPGGSTAGLTAVQVKVSMASTRGGEARRQIGTDSARVALRNNLGGTTC